MVYSTVVSNRPADPQEPIAYRDMPTPLGEMRLVASPKGLRGAWFTDQELLPSAEGWTHTESDPILEQARRELDEWFAGKRRKFDVALDPVGTTFQHKVWHALCALDFGALTSYGELARTVERPKGAQAVGGAVGRNPIIIIIPCHRVIGADTSLTGFGGGLPRKQALLAHEGNRYLSRNARARRVCDGQAELPW
ncbi:methylated-DNA--[protein]-cysteine S-methyltransferase [Achromobacter deleyi]|uniref:methylated-DNA--[protein]-cysteine S-methyltransferase n=1 Tax=Achromobacter deleyi TaxID=1353891 RepID=UPI0014915BD0|nr:methylated-DNA--[protein]-cysteine S-methyltransferase [Achromobacter deleyi]QVQ25744.1 methylated-DNA--[protein]-cysteine S-methyltransferase [Achromobacter deleyi]UIP21284.1 methylated-DNA--[protein]-cysteine S-methyltransferase [Achromobacter deleyi]